MASSLSLFACTSPQPCAPQADIGTSRPGWSLESSAHPSASPCKFACAAPRSHDLSLLWQLESLRVDAVRVVLLDHLLHLDVVDRLFLDEQLGQLVEQRAVGEERHLAAVVRLSHELGHFSIDALLHLSRGGLRTEAAVALGTLPRGGAQLVLGVAPLRHPH